MTKARDTKATKVSGRLLASGIFGWEGYERRSNRYGSIHLDSRPFNGDKIADAFYDLELLKSLDKKRVRLICKVTEVRTSGHVGDMFLGISPSTPAIGEVVDLGVGILGQKPGWDGSPEIILGPGDGRAELWLDPHKLYRLHDQTVSVYVEETSNDFGFRPRAGGKKRGAIDNGDGSYQVKTTASAVRLIPKVDCLGGGMFIVQPLTGTQRGEHFEIEDHDGEEEE